MVEIGDQGHIAALWYANELKKCMFVFLMLPLSPWVIKFICRHPVMRRGLNPTLVELDNGEFLLSLILYDNNENRTQKAQLLSSDFGLIGSEFQTL